MKEQVERAAGFGAEVAVVDGQGRHSYGALLDASERVALRLLEGAGDLEEARVGFLVRPGFGWVAVQWGIWRAGGIAVPLSPTHPGGELEYVIDDADVAVVVADGDLADRVRGIAGERGARLLVTEELVGAEEADREPIGSAGVELPRLGAERRAMILYTSGTTSRPKGVVTTHANIRAQVETLVGAWGWRSDDHTLLALPLHHVHGIINVVTCALWSGAKVTMHDRFDADEVWESIRRDELTVFMAVPTIYSRLIAAWEAAGDGRRAELSEACRRLRLMVSGSAALPVAVLERWREISGHVLLERYGMTEIGMALSNPLVGERRAARVGTPLPGVEVRLVDETGAVVGAGVAGEIEVRSPSVFREYWRRPEETASSFRDGWFRTGDVAVVEEGSYRILGRSSVDILKTGGYKVSALEVEEVLRGHPGIEECAVVGLPDDDLGERVAAGVVARPGHDITLGAVRSWCADRLAPYKVPRLVVTMDELPRNAMGKVVKPEVAKRIQAAK